MKVNQPSVRPTNKLSAAIVAAALVAIVRWLWPYADNDALWIALSPLVVWALGYLIPDEDNTP